MAKKMRAGQWINNNVGLDQSQLGFGMPLFLPKKIALSPAITVGLWSRPSWNLVVDVLEPNTTLIPIKLKGTMGMLKYVITI